MNYYEELQADQRSLTIKIMNIYNSWISKTNWSAVALVVVTITQAIIPFMSVPVQSVVTALLGAFIVIFHVQGVNKAAISSAALGTPSSGQ
jgi:hypothetical protein